MHCRYSWSQFGEDRFLETLFEGKKNGFYVEVGGFHPYRYSNTYLFYGLYDWRGVIVEPIPDYAKRIRVGRGQDQVLNLAVDSKLGKVDMYVNSAKSGISDSTYEWAEDVEKLSSISVDSKPLSQILKESNVPQNFDFISIDCEGHDRVVLESNDWEKFRPRIVLVEDHDSDGIGVNELMGGYDYEYLTQIGFTKFFQDKRHAL